MRIRVDTDYLWKVSRKIASAANVLHSLQKQLSAVWGQLNVAGWEGVYRDPVEQEWRQAQTRLNGLADQAEALSHFLTERADRFEKADRAGLAAVGQVTAAFAPIQQEWSQWFRPRQFALSLPQVLVGRLLRLGGENQPLPIFVTPGDLGEHLVGARYLRPIPSQWRQPLEKAIEMQRPAK